MKRSSSVLALVLCGTAFGQSGVLMSGNAIQNGVTLTYETRLEPASPAFASAFVGGVVTDPDGIHRYMAYNSERKFFGYDIQIEKPLVTDLVLRKGPTVSYRVVFRPLSIDPARVELKEPASWTTVLLPTYPDPQAVHESDSIALDLFTNPTTGQKIVDYLHFSRPELGGKAYEIAAGDVVYISVFHQPDVTGSAQVRPDGYIVVRFAGEVQAAGLTTKQLSDAITERLAKYYGHPEVNVQVVKINSPKFYLSGEVHRPGSYPLNKPTTILEAIVDAGGPADFAKTKKVYVLRGQEKLLFDYNDVSRGKHLEQNIQLQNGDIIVIP